MLRQLRGRPADGRTLAQRRTRPDSGLAISACSPRCSNARASWSHALNWVSGSGADDTFVEFDAGLNTAVAKLREALGDSADSPQLLETVPKRGYRLLAPVTPVPAAETVTPAPSQPTARLRPRDAAPSPFTRRVLFAGAAVIVAAALGAYWWAGRSLTRVAVVLFDNETDRQDFDRLAQTLTDSVVLRLGAESRLAVIGNSAILRSDRPFRDLKAIREDVRADFIVIGQLQVRPEGYRVLTHLIRASDEAHVWVKETPFTPGDEPVLEREIVEAIALAMRTRS